MDNNKKQLPIIVKYAESYLISGSLPAILFPAAGFFTSFMQLNSYDDYQECLQLRQQVESGYSDHLNHVLRSFTCWYYAFLLVYFFIIFKPFQIIYTISGILMTIVIAIGYIICFINLYYISSSQCSDQTTYGSIAKFNVLVFLVIGSFVIVLSHVLVFLPSCATLCSQANAQANSNQSQERNNVQPRQEDQNRVNPDENDGIE